jgi:hypothetical protein
MFFEQLRTYCSVQRAESKVYEGARMKEMATDDFRGYGAVLSWRVHLL